MSRERSGEIGEEGERGGKASWPAAVLAGRERNSTLESSSSQIIVA